MLSKEATKLHTAVQTRHHLLQCLEGDRAPEDLDFLATSRHPIKRNMGRKGRGMVSIQASGLGTLMGNIQGQTEH